MTSPDGGSDVEQKLGQAFEAFECTLREMLTEEARRSVDGTIERLSHVEGPFRLRGVEVEVVIRSLSVETADHGESRARPRPQGRRSASKSRTQSRGRPPGALRTAILDAFGAEDASLSTDDLRGHLRAREVEAKPDNLHQQLRRLVQAGELDRTGRGTYRRAAGKPGHKPA